MGGGLGSPENMTTQISFAGFFPFASSSNIFRKSLILLLCATPLTAFSQATTTPSAPRPAAVPTIAENLSVTPKFGQTQVQLAADRADCQLWAKAQTGFDPTQYGGGVGQSDYNSHRQQFGRAMAACLDGRGYSVHFAAPVNAPPTSPPPPPAAVAAAPVVRYSPPRPELRYHPFAVQIDGGYSIPSGTASQYIEGGPNYGLGLSWFPTSALPIGFRVDGSYSRFRAKDSLLNTGNFTSGHENFYGGDADIQLNLAHRSSAAQFYLFGGAGYYRQQTELRQVSWVNGTVCGYFYCAPGSFPAITAEQRTTSDWHHAWNAGMGFEIAMADRASFFIEARYLEILTNGNRTRFVPIRLGIRF
jgi:opacity protein-like surface antigen